MDRFVDADIRLLHSIFPKEKTQSDRKFLKSTIEEERLLLSIGQMIEFLDENLKTDWGIHFGKDLAFFSRSDKDGLYGKTPTNRKGTLCDGLWEIVKEILEK